MEVGLKVRDNSVSGYWEDITKDSVGYRLLETKKEADTEIVAGPVETDYNIDNSTKSFNNTTDRRTRLV